MLKDICRKNEDKIVTALEFGIFSPEELAQQSVIQVTNADFYDEARKPVDGGLLDTKLGVYKNGTCPTCGESGDSCIGHFGHIKLSHFIFPFHYFKDILKILKSICKECGHVLLDKVEKKHFDKKLNNPNRNYIQKKKIRKEIVSITEKRRLCDNCNCSNGNVKKVKSLCMFFHNKYVLKKSIESYHESIDILPKKIMSILKDGYEILRPANVYNLFKRVPVKHYKYLCFPREDNLSNLIFKSVSVPPTCIRMSALSQDSSREDDLSRCLEMLMVHNKLSDITNSYTRMIRPSAATATVRNDDKAIRGIVQRLSGKRGRFRGNLMGKRTNYTSRTVISPDPTLRIDQVSIPLHCALRLTFVERVTDFNIEYLRKAVLNGPNRHPGATKILKRAKKPGFVLKNLPEKKLLVNPSDWVQFRKRARQIQEAENLRVGDYVERHITDGDIVLFNRQPSLHRLSFQSFSVIVKKERTFSFNPCICNPFNADFDGDEMNIHFVQNYYAKAECQTLISSINNITSPNSGEPLTSPLQDILTAAYLFTSKDTFFTQEQFNHFIGLLYGRYRRDYTKILNLPKPAIWKPVKLYTGKQIISMVISPYRTSNGLPLPEVRINMETGNKSYKSGEDLNNTDSFVVVHNSDLVTGQLDKKMLGGNSKSSIFYRLIHDANNQASGNSMELLCNVVLPYLKERGFSIGLEDVTPSKKLRKIKSQLVNDNFNICQQFIKDYENNIMNCDPGCSLEETLEARISSQLSKIRDEGGKACKEDFSNSNAPLIMAICGSKGSFINVSQMVFCVGQQIIDGKRVREVKGLNRTLIFFDRNCKNPESKGFVRNSFRSGLKPSEFMFHAMSGREGLIDTAVKTAESGYMQRRLIKSLEDLVVNHDMTVRDSINTVVQFKYGIDNYDSSKVDHNNLPCDLNHELKHALQILTFEPFLTIDKLNDELNILIKKYTNRKGFDFLKDKVTTLLLDYLNSVKGKRFGLTKSQLNSFIESVYRKYQRAVIEPGTPVGVLCSQSIGEPATQMTLKTFHFAGVASMNITQGLPRFTEILNAVSKIKTPIIRIVPENDLNQELTARNIQMAIQPILLGDMIKEYQLQYSDISKFFYLVLDGEKLNRCGIKRSIIEQKLSNIKLEDYMFTVLNKKDEVDLYIEIFSTNGDVKEELVKQVLRKVQINGCPNVKGTVIKKEDDGECSVYVEGGNFENVIINAVSYGGDSRKIETNHIMDVFRVLGIEAARGAILKQLKEVMESYNLAPGERHLELTADFMCSLGEVHGFQRNGMERSKCSVLSLAAFERTLEHLTEASYHNQKDEITGVTDNIVFGKSVPLGTGMVSLLYDDEQLTKNVTDKIDNSSIQKESNDQINESSSALDRLLRKRKFIEA